MQQFWGGLLLGSVLGAGGLFGYWHFVMRGPEVPCDGRCGEGTICEGESCVLAPVEVVEQPSEDPSDKRKGKRRKGKGGSTEAGEGEVASSSAAWVDDSHVPKFDPNADQVIGMNDGSGRLSDAAVNKEMRELDSEFQACIRKAAEGVDELGTGKVSLEFGVSGKGKVTGVNVRAPSNLKDAGIVPCVRKAVYEHSFPAFDGPTMTVESSFEVK